MADQGNANSDTAVVINGNLKNYSSMRNLPNSADQEGKAAATSNIKGQANETSNLTPILKRTPVAMSAPIDVQTSEHSQMQRQPNHPHWLETGDTSTAEPWLQNLKLRTSSFSSQGSGQNNSNSRGNINASRNAASRPNLSDAAQQAPPVTRRLLEHHAQGGDGLYDGERLFTAGQSSLDAGDSTLSIGGASIGGGPSMTIGGDGSASEAKTDHNKSTTRLANSNLSMSIAPATNFPFCAEMPDVAIHNASSMSRNLGTASGTNLSRTCSQSSKNRRIDSQFPLISMSRSGTALGASDRNANGTRRSRNGSSGSISNASKSSSRSRKGEIVGTRILLPTDGNGQNDPRDRSISDYSVSNQSNQSNQSAGGGRDRGMSDYSIASHLSSAGWRKSSEMDSGMISPSRLSPMKKPSTAAAGPDATPHALQRDRTFSNFSNESGSSTRRKNFAKKAPIRSTLRERTISDQSRFQMSRLGTGSGKSRAGTAAASMESLAGGASTEHFPPNPNAESGSKDSQTFSKADFFRSQSPPKKIPIPFSPSKLAAGSFSPQKKVVSMTKLSSSKDAPSRGGFSPGSKPKTAGSPVRPKNAGNSDTHNTSIQRPFSPPNVSPRSMSLREGLLEERNIHTANSPFGRRPQRMGGFSPSKSSSKSSPEKKEAAKTEPPLGWKVEGAKMGVDNAKGNNAGGTKKEEEDGRRSTIVGEKKEEEDGKTKDNDINAGGKEVAGAVLEEHLVFPKQSSIEFDFKGLEAFRKVGAVNTDVSVTNVTHTAPTTVNKSSNDSDANDTAEEAHTVETSATEAPVETASTKEISEEPEPVASTALAIASSGNDVDEEGGLPGAAPDLTNLPDDVWDKVERSLYTLVSGPKKKAPEHKVELQAHCCAVDEEAILKVLLSVIQENRRFQADWCIYAFKLGRLVGSSDSVGMRVNERLMKLNSTQLLNGNSGGGSGGNGIGSGSGNNTMFKLEGGEEGTSGNANGNSNPSSFEEKVVRGKTPFDHSPGPTKKNNNASSPLKASPTSPPKGTPPKNSSSARSSPAKSSPSGSSGNTPPKPSLSQLLAPPTAGAVAVPPQEEALFSGNGNCPMGITALGSPAAQSSAANGQEPPTTNQEIVQKVADDSSNPQKPTSDSSQRPVASPFEDSKLVYDNCLVLCTVKKMGITGVASTNAPLPKQLLPLVVRQVKDLVWDIRGLGSAHTTPEDGDEEKKKSGSSNTNPSNGSNANPSNTHSESITLKDLVSASPGFVQVPDQCLPSSVTKQYREPKKLGGGSPLGSGSSPLGSPPGSAANKRRLAHEKKIRAVQKTPGYLHNTADTPNNLGNSVGARTSSRQGNRVEITATLPSDFNQGPSIRSQTLMLKRRKRQEPKNLKPIGGGNNVNGMHANNDDLANFGLGVKSLAFDFENRESGLPDFELKKKKLMMEKRRKYARNHFKSGMEGAGGRGKIRGDGADSDGGQEDEIEETLCDKLFKQPNLEQMMVNEESLRPFDPQDVQSLKALRRPAEPVEKVLQVLALLKGEVDAAQYDPGDDESSPNNAGHAAAAAAHTAAKNATSSAMPVSNKLIYEPGGWNLPQPRQAQQGNQRQQGEEDDEDDEAGNEMNEAEVAFLEAEGRHEGVRPTNSINDQQRLMMMVQMGMVDSNNLENCKHQELQPLQPRSKSYEQIPSFSQGRRRPASSKPTSSRPTSGVSRISSRPSSGVSRPDRMLGPGSNVLGPLGPLGGNSRPSSGVPSSRMSNRPESGRLTSSRNRPESGKRLAALESGIPGMPGNPNNRPISGRPISGGRRLPLDQVQLAPLNDRNRNANINNAINAINTANVPPSGLGIVASSSRLDSRRNPIQSRQPIQSRGTRAGGGGGFGASHTALGASPGMSAPAVAPSFGSSPGLMEPAGNPVVNAAQSSLAAALGGLASNDPPLQQLGQQLSEQLGSYCVSSLGSEGSQISQSPESSLYGSPLGGSPSKNNEMRALRGMANLNSARLNAQQDSPPLRQGGGLRLLEFQDGQSSNGDNRDYRERDGSVGLNSMNSTARSAFNTTSLGKSISNKGMNLSSQIKCSPKRGSSTGISLPQKRRLEPASPGAASPDGHGHSSDPNSNQVVHSVPTIPAAGKTTAQQKPAEKPDPLSQIKFPLWPTLKDKVLSKNLRMELLFLHLGVVDDGNLMAACDLLDTIDLDEVRRICPAASVLADYCKNLLEDDATDEKHASGPHIQHAMLSKDPKIGLHTLSVEETFELKRKQIAHAKLKKKVKGRGDHAFPTG